MGKPDETSTIHASCVAFQSRGLLILGASGTGKSGLALQMIGLGAQLVADDRVHLSCVDNRLVAACPPQIANMIEARGIGILNVPALGPTTVQAALSLDHAETERLPTLDRQCNLLGCTLPLLHKVDTPSFPAALLQYLAGGTTEGLPREH